MKYQKEFNKSKNKEGFIKLVLHNYPQIKRSTANRRYYDYHVENKHNINEKETLTYLHQILLKDAKRYKMKITRGFLLKLGFTNYEINWLEDKQELDEGDNY